jgi:hypothetical protein
VNRGEEIIITYRGKPCAKLIPYDELKKNNLFGIWKNNNIVEDVNDYIRNLRLGGMYDFYQNHPQVSNQGQTKSQSQENWYEFY